VAGAADIGIAAALEGLVRPDLIAEVVDMAGRCRGKLIAELVIEAFAVEIALVARYPFVQPHMRRDDEFRHGVSPEASASLQ
jgi:hypothetical protein